MTVDAPAPRDYAQETRDTLQAQLDLAPQKYAAEAQYAPQYQALQLGMLKSAMPQLLDVYGQAAPRLGQIESAARSASRAGDIADIANLGPQARAAIRASNPDQAAMIDRMTAQANSGLAAGSNLTPEQQNMVTQQLRSGLAARGLANQPSGAMQEAVRSQMMGAGLQQQRSQQAMQALGASQGLYGDVFQQILGRPSQAFGATGAMTNQAQGFNPGQLFNPESAYAQNIYAGNQQSQLAANAAGASATGSMIGGGLSALGSMGGGMFQAAGNAGGFGNLFGCYVARECIPDQWEAFFFWKELAGPEWFRNLYDQNAKEFAQFISDKPAIKRVIAWWMKAKINSIFN
jgi:hypothetical protein